MTGMKEGAGEDPFADDERQRDGTPGEGDDAGTETGGEYGGPDDDETDDSGTGDSEICDSITNDSETEDSETDDGGMVVTGNNNGEAGLDEGNGAQNSEAGNAVIPAGERDVATQSGEGAVEQQTAESGVDSDGSQPVPRERMMEIPYKLRRDSVQDGRNRVPLFLQEGTKTAERDALRELEDGLDDDVSLTDLREALVIVGLGRLDEVEEQLEQWGYGMTFDA